MKLNASTVVGLFILICVLAAMISIAVMQERGIHESLTSDRHFVQAGFQALLIGD